MSEPTVAPETPGPEWDAFVAGHPRATAYHLGAWATVLSRAYRMGPCYLVARREGAVVGVLPLVDSGRRLTGRRVSSLPVARVAGPLAADDAALAALLIAARDMARARGAGLLVIRSEIAGLDEHAGLVAHADQPTWRLAVGEPDAMRETWRRTSKNLARSIGRAEREQVTVREGTGGQGIRAFYALYLETMHMHRSLPRSPVQFLEQQRHLGGVFRVLLAEHRGVAVAGAVFHVFGGVYELLYNGSSRSSRDVRPNHALYVHALRQAWAEGCETFDFGGAIPGTSLGDFKAQWGAEPVPVHRYVVGEPPSAPGPPPVAAAPAPGRPGRRGALVEQIWERAPARAVQAAGTLANRWA